MNNYYFIRQSSDPRVIGVSDASSQASLVREQFTNKLYYDNYVNYYENIDEPKLYWKNRLELPDFEIEFEYLKLNKKAILTDFIDFSPNLFNGGLFLLSERAINVFEQFKLARHKIFNAYIFNDNKRTKYYFLCSSLLPYDVIDFEKTIFFEGSEILGKKFLRLSSGEQFEDKKEKELFDAEKIVFNETFDVSLDYFIPAISIPTIFISKRLKDAIEAEKLTGLNILPAATRIELS